MVDLVNLKRKAHYASVYGTCVVLVAKKKKKKKRMLLTALLFGFVTLLFGFVTNIWNAHIERVELRTQRATKPFKTNVLLFENK